MKGFIVGVLSVVLAQILQAQEPCAPPPKVTGEWVNPITMQQEVFCYWSPINECPDAVWFRQFARTNELGEMITPWFYPTQLLTRPGYLGTNGAFVWDPKFIVFFPPPNNIINRAVPVDLEFFGTPPRLPTPPPVPELQPLTIAGITASGQIQPILKPKPKAKRKRKR